ncbi:MAG: 1-deoxy-D-xylulose-5-phosphate reductoisomerase [Planctomycetota bacterium]|jgi:1-deoxy-D-xylulose-5-phosphate reductoisomerase
MKRIALLGSTGSIGTQTLDLVRESAGGLYVDAMAANSSWEKVAEQVAEFRPKFVAMADESAAAALRERVAGDCKVFGGDDAVLELLRESNYDICVHGIVGAVGLRPSVAVLKRGKTLALANKESMVVAGAYLMDLAREHGAEIVPVDSEHSAVFQCLRGEDLGRVRRVLLTASGGPFRENSLESLKSVTPSMALKHPNWVMGPRITVGSATLMNKALEVIELHHLFGLETERIQVVVHPQSIVHSMVEFVDGSVIAQMGPPDMRGPIHYALHHPDRAPAELAGFDFTLFKRLDFLEPDLQRFPALGLGYRCVEEGADSGSVLNASDEVAVAAFLDERIQFNDINRINTAVLDRRPGLAANLDDLLEADQVARRMATDEIAALAN